MSGKDFGGRITMRLSTGQTFSLRGNCQHMPARNSVEPITNQDASLDRIATPRSPSFEISFADKGVPLDVLMEADRFNVTFDEEFTGITHLYTGGFMTGEPTVNRLNGEVTGLGGSAESYNRIGG